MNYTSENTDLRSWVLSLLGDGFESTRSVSIGVSYGQGRRLTVIVVEVAPTSIVHGLLFFYSRGLRLFGAYVCRNNRFFRISRSKDALQKVDAVNRHLMKSIPKSNPISPRKIREDGASEDSDDRQDAEIQKLKDQNRIQRERNRIEKDMAKSLRNQIKVLKAKSA
jgi:hypothetical protein